jgi:hypothetical protein
MWLIIGIGTPILILAIAIAVAPVLFGSVRFHRWHHRQPRVRPATSSPRRIRCPLCTAQLEGANAGAAIAARNDHVLREHAHEKEESFRANAG